MVVRVDGEVLDELINEGHKPVPMQWIEVEKNQHLMRPGKQHEPKMKSRLVTCGQLEDCTGIRSDSPTADVEGLNLVCSFAACRKLRYIAVTLVTHISMVFHWIAYC